MLEHVSRGQKLTTDLVNGIIDKANGQMIPSNGAFVNTQNGTLFINDNKQLPSDMTFTTTTFLNCQIQKRQMLEERPFKYENGEFKRKIFVNLGNNISTSKSLIKYNCNAIEEILLITGDDENFDYKVDNEILQPTTSQDNKLALMNTGFVDTNVVYENALAIFGTIYKFVEDKEKPENAKYYFVVTDKTNDLKDRIKTLLQDDISFDDEKSEIIKLFQQQLAISTAPGKNKASVIIQTPFINFIDTLSSGSGNCDCKPISVDTQISALNRKSIDTQTYEYELSTEVEKLDEDGKVVIGTDGKPVMEIKVEKLSVDYYELYQFGCTVNDDCRKISEFFKKDENGCGCTNDKLTLVSRVEKEDEETGETKAEIEYIQFDLSNGIEISGDSQQEDTLSKSVALSSIDGKKCYTLHNFNGGCADAYLTQEAPYEYLGCDAFAITYFGENDMLYDYAHNGQLLMRLNKDDSGDCELKYIDLYSLTSILPNTDTEIFSGCEDGQKSIEIKYGCAEIDGYYRQIQAYQLYGIDRPSDIEEEYTKTVIKRQGNDPDSDYGDSNYTESLLPEGYEFVVRTVNSEGCGTIHYMPLSVGVELPETDTKVGISKSVTVRDDNGEYLTLYNFTKNNVGSYTANYKDYIDDNGFFVDGCDGILFRKTTNLDNENQEPELHYITFESLKDYVQPIGDADVASRNDADERDSYSIEIKTTKEHIDYYQLYNFDDANVESEYINLNPDSNVCLNVDDDAFLVRTTDENGQPVLKYKQIYVKQDSNGNTNYGEDITNIYDQINYLSGEIYNLSGTCSSDLSGAWIKGGTYEENYGQSIGDSDQNEVIYLDGRELIGDWYQRDGIMTFSNYESNYYSTTIDGGTVYAYSLDGEYITSNNEIRIGCTSINEEQLQRLLALLN